MLAIVTSFSLALSQIWRSSLSSFRYSRSGTRSKVNTVWEHVAKHGTLGKAFLESSLFLSSNLILGLHTLPIAQLTENFPCMAIVGNNSVI